MSQRLRLRAHLDVRQRAVLTELVRRVDGIEVVQRGISTERIATAVRRSDAELLRRINTAQQELENDGRLPGFRLQWLGSPVLDQSERRR